MQAISEEKATKRREQQAEYDRVSEIHRGRLESSSVDATDAATVQLHRAHTLPGSLLREQHVLVQLLQLMLQNSRKAQNGQLGFACIAWDGAAVPPHPSGTDLIVRCISL